ncbi:MAG: hypothetical protein GEV08_24055, partial [Acidimicrobiia bacterium]|nr:hypothetical protein [Acidimicrobiia bacterium]
MALFPAKDGWLCIGAASLEQWERFCITIGAVELLADERLFAPAERFDRADEVDAPLLAWLATRTATEAVEELQANRVPAGKVLDFAQLLEEPHLRERGFWAPARHLGASARVPAAPYRVGAGAAAGASAAPALGEHTAPVLAE